MATRGWENVTLSDIGMRAFPKPGKKAAAVPAKARSKYRAIRCEVDGIAFASKAEARRYAELKCLQAAGKIFRLQLQPRYRLCAWSNREDGELPEIGYYVADFRYCNHAGCTCAWGCTVEDVKGWRTLPMARWKMKHFTAQYGLTVREIR